MLNNLEVYPPNQGVRIMEILQGQMRMAAIQYDKILAYVRKNATVENPLTGLRVFEALRTEVRNRAQVSDALASCTKGKLLFSVRTGAEISYWPNPAKIKLPRSRKVYTHVKQLIAKNEAVKPVLEAPTSVLQSIAKEKVFLRPEIRVEENRIIIEHPKCRVIVELN